MSEDRSIRALVEQLRREIRWTHDAGFTACHYPGNDESCDDDGHYYCDRAMFKEAARQITEELSAALAVPPPSQVKAQQRLDRAVDLLREWCEQDGWTDTSVNDHMNVCRDFIAEVETVGPALPQPEQEQKK